MDIGLSVVVPCSVLTSAGEQLHPAHGLTGQWLLIIRVGDIQDQRTCSTLLTLTSKQTPLIANVFMNRKADSSIAWEPVPSRWLETKFLFATKPTMKLSLLFV